MEFLLKNKVFLSHSDSLFVLKFQFTIVIPDAMSSQHLGSDAFSPSYLGNRTGWNM